MFNKKRLGARRRRASRGRGHGGRLDARAGRRRAVDDRNADGEHGQGRGAAPPLERARPKRGVAIIGRTEGERIRGRNDATSQPAALPVPAAATCRRANGARGRRRPPGYASLRLPAASSSSSTRGRAPLTVEAFLKYVERRVSTRAVIFHRVVAGFIAQAGGYTADIDAEARHGSGRQRIGQRLEQSARHGRFRAHATSRTPARASSTSTSPTTST